MKNSLISFFIIIGVYMTPYMGTAQTQNVLNDSLLEASYDGQLNQVKQLIIRGADVNAKNKEGYTALMNASLRGSIEIVNLLVASGTNVNAKNSDGITAIMIASGENHNEILKFLVNKKADVNAKADNGYTPLMFACQVGNLNAVKELLKNTIEINACSNLGATALMLATENGHSEIVKLLLEAKADINVLEKTNGMSSLNIASYRGYSDIVNSLLEAKADVNLANKYDMTPLYIASLNGRTEIVKELINSGADLNKTESQNGKTALIAVAEKGYADIAKILLDNGADAEIGDSFGLNASAHASLKGHDTIVNYLRNDNHAADSSNQKVDDLEQSLFNAAKNGQTSKLKELISKGVNINAKDDFGWSILMYVAESGNIEIVKMLTAKKANINVTGTGGWTALIAATSEGHLEIVRILIDNGADVNAKDFDIGWTSLHYASNPDIIKLLIAHGAKVNAIDKGGETPLMLAAKYGHAEIVKIFLENGADLNIKDKNGDSALELAKKNGKVECTKLLEQTPPKQLTIYKNGNLRNGPSTQENIIGKVNAGTKVIQIGKNDDWYKIKLPDNKIGWINKVLMTYNSELIIPIEIEYQDEETNTMGEIFFIEGLDNMLILSFDCENCNGEALVLTNGSKILAWTPGAKHLYKGNNVNIGYEYSIDFKMKTNNRGKLISYGDKGSTPITNKIKGWSILGQPKDPLEFEVIKDVGYVYIKGSGKVVAPDSTIYKIGEGF